MSVAISVLQNVQDKRKKITRKVLVTNFYLPGKKNEEKHIVWKNKD